MSIHRSLVSGTRDRKHRSVLKRFEKVKILEKAERWKAGDSIFGLPKVKVLRVKVKKEKAEEAPVVAAEAPAAETAQTQTEQSKKGKKEGKE